MKKLFKTGNLPKEIFIKITEPDFFCDRNLDRTRLSVVMEVAETIVFPALGIFET